MASRGLRSFLQEEHNFFIDQQGLARLHDLYLSIGRRLVQEGVLAEADDVFMLLVDELRNLFANPDAMAQTDFVRSLVQRRHEELAIAKTLTPPPFLGDPPQEPPAGNPMVRAMGRFFGGPPQQSAASDQLQGNPGSRGTVSGKARVRADPGRGIEPAARRDSGRRYNHAPMDTALRNRGGGGHRNRRTAQPLRDCRPRIRHTGRGGRARGDEPDCHRANHFGGWRAGVVTLHE